MNATSAHQAVTVARTPCTTASAMRLLNVSLSLAAVTRVVYFLVPTWVARWVGWVDAGSWQVDYRLL